MIKNFCRLLVDEELTEEQVNDFYDVVTAIIPDKPVVGYTDDDDVVTVEVTQYESYDHYVYEIVLAETVEESEGDDIMRELQNTFEFDFDFEASLEA